MSRSFLFAAIAVLALSACAQAQNPAVDDLQESWWFSPEEAKEAVATPSPVEPTLAPAMQVKHTESYKFILTEFDNVLDIIQDETDFDNALVAAKTKLVKEAEAAEKSAEVAYNAAVAAFELAKAAYEKAEAEYNKAYSTYLKNKAVRDSEKDLSNSIQGHVASLSAVGSESEAEADLQLSASDITIENLEVAHKATAESLHGLMSMVKRSSVHTNTMATQLKAIDSRLDAEESTEKAHVAAKKDARDQAKVVMEAKEAQRIAAKANWEKTKELLAAARVVLADTIRMRDENEIKRNVERGIIKQASDFINAFIGTGTAESLDLQLARSNQHTNAIEKALAGIKAKVEEEERNQAAEVASALAAKNLAYNNLQAAIEHYNEMSAIVVEATAEVARKQSDYDIAHKTIAVERATANQERRAISAMFTTLVRLSNRRVSAAGACPVDRSGAICSGNGLCVEGRSKCACHFGSSGADCGDCVEGFSKSNGICEKSITASIQVDSADIASVAAKYGLVDLSVDNLNLPYEKVHAAIQQIMETLEAQEAKLEADLAKAAAALAAAKAALTVALDNQQKALEARDAAQAVYDEKSAVYQAIYEQYVRDKALRTTQLSVIAEVSKILGQLTGST